MVTKTQKATRRAEIERANKADAAKRKPTVLGSLKEGVKSAAKMVVQRRKPAETVKPKSPIKRVSANGTTLRSPKEYFSGKTFDAKQREAMKKAGIE